MIHAANNQGHQIRFSTHIGIHHHRMLGSSQNQYSYPGRLLSVIPFAEQKGVQQAQQKEEQGRQPICPDGNAKQFKAYEHHPEWEVWFI